MVRRHHQLNEHEFEQTPGDGEGLGSLACCNPWGHRGDMTERLNNSNNKAYGVNTVISVLEETEDGGKEAHRN